MKNTEQTIGNLIEKAGVSIISSVEEDGFPNTKAMLPPTGRYYCNFKSDDFVIE